MCFNFVSLFALILGFCYVHCEVKPLLSINERLQTYKNYIKASVELGKQDSTLINTWMEEMQVKQVNITSTYRLQMTRHKEYCFRRNANKKWLICMETYEKDIKKPEKVYHDNESECLKVANSADIDKKLAVTQIDKEIRKWRKSYRYLSNLCNMNHPDNEEEAGVCLVEYMQRDNFNVAIQRLFALKLEAMGNLYKATYITMDNLEDCLKTYFSRYLESIRVIMGILRKCYEATTGRIQKERINCLQYFKHLIK